MFLTHIKHRSHIRDWPFRAHLLAFGLTIVIPVLVFSGLVLSRYHALDRVRFEERLLDTAQEVTFALDQMFEGMRSTLSVIASSQFLQTSDLAAFHRQARATQLQHEPIIVLTDLSGRQLVNTRYPWGAELPVSANPSVHPSSRKTTEIKVSDLFSGATSRDTQFSLTVPIVANGEIRFFLSMAYLPSRVQEILNHYNVPASWAVAVSDSNGKIIARSNFLQGLATAELTPEMVDLSSRPNGVGTINHTDGSSSIVGCSRSKIANWIACAIVPMSVADAPLTQGWRLFATSGAGLLLLSLLLALAFGRRLALPIRRVAEQASTLAPHSTVEPIRTTVSELNAVSAALSDASIQIRDKTSELEERRRALSQSNAQLEAQVAARTRDLQDEMKHRELAQAELIHAKKMEAIGRLVAGVAHDFNNILAVIIANQEMLEPHLTENKSLRLLHRAEKAAELGADLTRRLLTVARRQALTPEVVNLNDRLRAITDLLGRTLGKEIVLQTRFVEDLWKTCIDPGEMDSAVLNMAVNARDAMPQGGTLTLVSGNVKVDEAFAQADAGLKRGEYVLVSMSDTGVGMAADTLDRVFEPFFTTKEKGTGLGLATVYGFARQSGGHVTIHSKQGRGTTVSIYLPRASDAPKVATNAPRIRPERAVADKTILVVDDDEPVLETTADQLQQLGYRVMVAASGLAAVEALQSGHEIDLVFSDIVMGSGMSGIELAEWVHTHRPRVRLLLTSGFFDELVRGKRPADAHPRVLRKPYSRVELVKALDETFALPCAA